MRAQVFGVVAVVALMAVLVSGEPRQWTAWNTAWTVIGLLAIAGVIWPRKA